ncbi:OmpA family protein [Treponema pectinovorum]|uniref:OmpA family protein n=1 Tax=Treponema pectinovorum TaxID=164 RepID=UPI0020909AB3|nr:OmpA family protein [Treponema pectinovorum]
MKKNLLISFFALFTLAQIFCQDGSITCESVIDWTKNIFSSSVKIDLDKANIQMPSGKLTAVDLINTQLTQLIKDPLLTTYVNSNTQLADLVLCDDITLEDLRTIVNTSKKTPGIFINSSSVLQVIHNLDTLRLSSILIKHKTPYKNSKPIETVPSRPYTGIIIDARGSLSVHGEFTKDVVKPCFFPEIWDEDMNLIYERNMGDPKIESEQGFVHYDWSEDENRYKDRIGIDPLHISARKVYGRFRTDPVISRKDALKILSVPANLELLRQGKVVVLLDKENLITKVSAPEKNAEYYAAIRELKQYLFTNEEDEPQIEDTIRGIQILYDLKFVADSPELLQSELPKLQKLAESLKKINIDNAYTILVEGHTADVQKPEGQMRLSIQRTQTIIGELVKNGLDKNLFSYRGYGGTQPIASNATDEGRALNRRVVITARPKATYIQRN